MQRTEPQHPVKHVPVIYVQVDDVTAGKNAANGKLTPTVLSCAMTMLSPNFGGKEEKNYAT